MKRSKASSNKQTIKVLTDLIQCWNVCVFMMAYKGVPAHQVLDSLKKQGIKPGFIKRAEQLLKKLRGPGKKA